MALGMDTRCLNPRFRPVKRHNLAVFGIVVISALAGTLAGTKAVGAEAQAATNPTEVRQIQESILLSIDKSTMTAELRTWPQEQAESRLLSSFRIAMGKERGDKFREGDNRTPEGIYFTQKHIPGKKLLKEKYGPWAIPIDFPNSFDRLQGKTGYGIWLHGAGNDERIAKINVTEGCVAFYNSDITRLSSWLEPYQGLVVIAKDHQGVNKKRDITDIRALTKSWLAAWQRRSVEDYIAHYASDFRYGARHREAYRRYKSRVFKSYKNMKVEMSNLRVVTHPKYAVSVMNQDFDGDGRYVSLGRKVLYWSREAGGKWRIIREVFSDRRFDIPSFDENDLSLLTPASPPRKSRALVDKTATSAKS